MGSGAWRVSQQGADIGAGEVVQEGAAAIGWPVGLA